MSKSLTRKTGQLIAARCIYRLSRIRGVPTPNNSLWRSVAAWTRRAERGAVYAGIVKRQVIGAIRWAMRRLPPTSKCSTET